MEKNRKKTFKIQKKNYLLTYFLDSINENKILEIKNIAEENNLDIVNLRNILDYYDLSSYTYDPSNMIYLIDHCSLMLTDSFHGCVFSIIFNKPFYVFDREGNMENMNSRLETLLNKLKLNKHKIDRLSNVNDLFLSDYKEAERIIEKERIKSFKFLKKAIKE